MNSGSTEGTGSADSVQQLDAAAQAIVELHATLAEREPLDVALQRVAAGAVAIIPDADAVTITVLGNGDAGTEAWTDDRYLALDKQQYATNRGPCLDAARTHQPVRASTNQDRHRWPEFAAAAEQVGVAAYLSVPLLVEPAGHARELVGSLNIYSHNPEGFDSFDEALMTVFRVAAQQEISLTRLWTQSRGQVANLEIALTTRAEIDQAKGILMGAHRCSADEAFRMLVTQSQGRNIKVRELAREFIDWVIAKPN